MGGMLRPDLPADHFCAWRDEAERLSGRLDEVERQLVELRRKVFGRRSEKTKVVPVDRELRKERPVDRAAVQKKRAANAARKKALVTEVVDHHVPEDQRTCPACDAGAAGMKPVVAGRESVEIEYVAAYFRRRVHRRETLACRCGQYIVTAPAPPRVTDKTAYGPGFVAHVITSKCSISTPIYRLEKYYAQTGIPLARSTMNDLVHRAASVLSPLAQRILARVAAAEVVHADETPHRLQTTPTRPYFWTFTDGQLIAYQCSANRSGETPARVLGSSTGTLVVDAHTGYNTVTKPGGRRRAGCMAHARRKFFEALATAPEAHVALDAIRAVYRVEHDALEAGVQRTDEHLAMRQARSRPILDELHRWLKEQKGQHPPKGPMGRAIGYALRQWEALTVFLDDAKIPPDNNASERALKVIALGRKNFLFFGHEHAGDNFAVLYTLVSSCEAVGISPLEYLADVLLRVQTHPADRIDDLLPDRWTPPSAPLAAAA
jgi:transposase